MEPPSFKALVAGDIRELPMRIGEKSAAERNQLTETVQVRTPNGLRSDGKLFAVRMVGESMVDAGILAGDTLIFRSSSARDGDIVLAAVLVTLVQDLA